MIYKPDEVYKSPNFGYPKRGTKGRQGEKPIGVGVHISGGEWEGNKAWILNPKANASYNVLIKRDGTIAQFVDPSNAAWSHGAIKSPKWPLLRSGINPNIYTLSISRVGSDQRKWDPPQMDSTVKVIKQWSKEYGFPAEWPHVFGHKHIDSVNRWYCPGDPFLNELYVRLAIEDTPEELPDELPDELPEQTVWQVIAGSYRDKHTAEMVRGNLLRMGVTGVYLNPVMRPK